MIWSTFLDDNWLDESWQSFLSTIHGEDDKLLSLVLSFLMNYTLNSYINILLADKPTYITFCIAANQVVIWE